MISVIPLAYFAASSHLAALAQTEAAPTRPIISPRTSTPTPSPTATATTTLTPTPTITPTFTPGPYGVTWSPNCLDEAIENGYLDRNVCVPGRITKDSWYLGGPPHLIGIGTYYAAGIMEQVAENRGMSLDRYKDGVAMMSPADLGKTVWLRRPGGGWEGPFLVVDCSTRLGMFVNTGINGMVVEVGNRTAVRWGMAGGINGIEVYKGSSPPDGGRATFYRTWWLARVQFESPLGGTP